MHRQPGLAQGVGYGRAGAEGNVAFGTGASFEDGKDLKGFFHGCIIE
jgi:hypothetical protein